MDSLSTTGAGLVDLVDRLPLDICRLVFEAFCDANGAARTIHLGAVSSKWRNILLGMPRLWSCIVLSPKTCQEQVDTWLERSRGAIDVLEIRVPSASQRLPPQTAITRFASLSGLRVLKIHLAYWHLENRNFEDVLPRDILDCANLRTLSITLSGFQQGTIPKAFVDFLTRINVKRVQTLALRLEGKLFPWKVLTGMAIDDLRELEVSSRQFSFIDTTPFLAQHPELDTLILSRKHDTDLVHRRTYFSLPSPDRIFELRSLAHLSVTHIDLEAIVARVRCPNLRSLSIAGCAHIEHRQSTHEFFTVTFPGPVL